ncbi:AMP-binding protein [Naumannella huperziae]
MPDNEAALSIASGSTEQPLLDQTIPANLAETVRRWPDRDALVESFTGRRWTWAEFATDVDRVARALLALGLTKGDRLGIWSPNSAEWTLTQYATARIGVIAVNINPAYRTHELSYALNQSGCVAVVASPAYKTSDYPAMIESVRQNVPSLRHVVITDDESWREFLAGADGVDAGEAERIAATLRPEDPINIQYTSGTTGHPKGATLSHRNILNNGYFTTERIGFTEQDKLVIAPPFYHCFGMVMGNLGCTSHGATMIIPSPSFDPAASLQAVHDERATALYGVPTMFIAELALPNFADYDLSSLRTGIMAGSPCPVEVMKRVMTEMHMSEVSIAYGMTETSPVSTQTGGDDDVERRTATVGRVHPHVEIKIIDPASGEVVPRGEIGEFCTRGYSVMLGYWDEPEKTAEAVDADGWMHTGDLGMMRPDGYVTINGRIKDMVIRGGENIYPREIEEFLYTHPKIADVQVVGVPDEKYGEELCAFVQLRDGENELSAEDVAAFSEGKLARFKIPRYVLVVDEFPMTVTGKIRKVEMRADAAQQLGLA